MPEKIDKFEFFEIMHNYVEEVGRLFSLRSKGKDPYPSENLRPSSLGDWLKSFVQVKLNPFADDRIRTHYREILGDETTPYNRLDRIRISSLFPSGERICLISSPFDHVGLPHDDAFDSFKLAKLAPDNLTLNFMSDPGYFFLLFPKEIQQQCVIDVPEYKSPRMPSETEIKELRKIFFAALDRMAKLYEPLDKLIGPK